MSVYSEDAQNRLLRLAKFICADLNVTYDRFHNPYARGSVSKARHIFVLVATDYEFTYPDVAAVLRRTPSFITQTRRRKYGLRKEIEYIHAKAFLEQMSKATMEALDA